VVWVSDTSHSTRNESLSSGISFRFQSVLTIIFLSISYLSHAIGGGTTFEPL
jgi:hypothetical protein